MIRRRTYIEKIEAGFRLHPVVSILGSRQCGKSTLARMYCRNKSTEYFDLENPVDRRRLETPMRALEPLRGLVVLDEIQLIPGRFGGRKLRVAAGL